MKKGNECAQTIGQGSEDKDIDSKRVGERRSIL